MKQKSLVLATIFIVFAYLSTLFYSIYYNASNYDETANIVAGLSIWKHGRFDLYRVNPPLYKIIAAAPLLACDPHVNWKSYYEYTRSREPGARPEFSMAIEFAQNNRENLRRYLIIARLACVPFALLGAYYTWRWGTELFGALLLFFFACLLALRRARAEKCDSATLDYICLLAPGVTLFVFVSLQSGFSRHFRYVLPALPCFYIMASSVFSERTRLDRTWFRALAFGCVVWFVASALSVFPHSLSYFNALAGGPRNAWRYFLESNLDWGQDGYALQAWLDRRERQDVLESVAFVIPRLLRARHFLSHFENDAEYE